MKHVVHHDSGDRVGINWVYLVADCREWIPETGASGKNRISKKWENVTCKRCLKKKLKEEAVGRRDR